MSKYLVVTALYPKTLPKVYLLDEITSDLDIYAREGLQSPWTFVHLHVSTATHTTWDAMKTRSLFKDCTSEYPSSQRWDLGKS
eukprot:5193719-Amphidinium_carterae.1